MNKKNLVALAVLVGIAGYVACSRATILGPSPHATDTITVSSTSIAENQAPEERSTLATVHTTIKIDKAAYIIPFTDGQTVLDVMRMATKDGFTFSGSDYPGLGFFVESIQGKENSDEYYWTLYLNGAMSTLGASALKLHSSDIVEWRYEK